MSLICDFKFSCGLIKKNFKRSGETNLMIRFYLTHYIPNMRISMGKITMSCITYIFLKSLKSGVYFTFCPSEFGPATFHVLNGHMRPVAAAFPSSRESPGLYGAEEQCLVLRPQGVAQG